MAAGETFWVTWEAEQDGIVTLEDGREVFVTYGDELLVHQTGRDSVIFLDYEAKTVH